MLTGIILENFKAFKARQFIPIRPITLIYGPNSAGKSSIVHALALLKHAFLNHGHAEADRVDMRWSEVRLGGWQNLVHRHDGNATFKIGFQFNVSNSVEECFEKDEHGNLTPEECEESPPDAWEVVWEFGRDGEGDEATVKTVEARRNGLPEFDGTWCRENRRWNLTRHSSSLRHDEFTSEHFLKSYLKAGKINIPEASKPGTLSWFESLKGVPCEGFFPNSNPKRDKNTEVYERLPDDLHTKFLDKLFTLSAHDVRHPSSKGDFSPENNRVMEGLEKIKAGKSPDEEETQALRKIHEEWAYLFSAATPIYERAATAFETIIQDHCHLDPVRARPTCNLNLKDLPLIPTYEPWRQLISDKKIREPSSNALGILTRQPGQKTGYRLAMRNRTVEISGIGCDQSIKSTTEELSILNPQGVLLGLADVGYGIATTIPIVTALNMDHCGLISVEQPELHTHPRFQTELGDFFIQSALKDKNKRAFLIESHSEHLILRILRRIRETTEVGTNVWPKTLREACPNGISAEDVTVFYIATRGGEGGSKGINLPVTLDGDFSRPWPSGFFAERIRELYSIEEAEE